MHKDLSFSCDLRHLHLLLFRFDVALISDLDPWQIAYIDLSELSLSGLNHGLGYAICSPDLLDL